MTVINLYTADQHLIAAQKVKIASGDVESVQLQVVFDDAWNDYSARTAVFHTAKNTTPVEMLLTDDACVVPHEVLAEAGTLFIGVRGATIDGTAIKTSTLVKYKIEQGADAGYTTLNPTMDLYQQFLAAVNGHLDPFTTALNKRFEDYVAEVNETLNGTELWTNPDITTAFAAQTIALDLSEYTRFKIVFANQNSGGFLEEAECCCKGETYALITDDDELSRYRKYKMTDSGAEFEDAYIRASTKSNGWCIPYKIIGYKSGGIATA